MITFYNRNKTDFTHNGLGILDNYIINPVVCEEVNGIFSLEFDFPLNAPHADELLQERIVKCPVPEMPPQLFRISEREAGLGGIFHIVAYHVFYDLVQNLIEDTFVVNRNGNYADDEDAIPLPEAYALLRNLAAKEYSDNHIDVPNATYNVEFAPLERTEEYKNFSVLEKIAIGDTVKVVHEEDSLDISARMVSYKYNPFTQSYISITLGNFSPRFTDISKTIQRIETDISQANDNANFALRSANGKNTNFYGDEEPDNAREGDLWFKENGEKLELWVFEKRDGVTQWFPLINDLTQEEIRLELEEAKGLVAEAVTKSEDAKVAGQAAETAATQAKSESQNAVIKANQAFDSAESAIVKIGNPFIIKKWEQGSIDSGGENVDSDSNLRSEYISVKSGDKYIAQFPDGEEPLTAHYHFFSMRVWMVSLAMKGEEYSTIRRRMLAPLSGNSGFRYDDKQPRNPRGERVQKEVLSIRLTPEVLGKVEELASQSEMTRNAFIESVVGEYAERETAPAADESEVDGDE